MSARPGPPDQRSHLWEDLNRAAAEGRFRLQVCARCEKVQYPPQEFCHHCLNGALLWEQVSAMGTVLSWTTLHVSLDRFFQDKLPLHTGMIKLDCGPALLAHLAAASRRTGSRVRVACRPDKSGQAVFFAAPPDADPATEFSTLLEE